MSELAGVGDFNRDGFTDLVARLTADGELLPVPRAGRRLRRPAVQLGTGWSGMRDLIGVGDFDRDGFTDLAAVVTTSGVVYLYRGTGTAGFRTRSPDHVTGSHL